MQSPATDTLLVFNRWKGKAEAGVNCFTQEDQHVDHTARQRQSCDSKSCLMTDLQPEPDASQLFSHIKMLRDLGLLLIHKNLADPLAPSVDPSDSAYPSSGPLISMALSGAHKASHL